MSAGRPGARWVVPVGCAALLVATSACRDSSPTRPPAPTRVHTSPIGSGEDGSRGTGRATGGALPTWTLPAAAPAPGEGPSRASDPGSGPAEPGALSGVPAPTVVPTPIGGLAGPPADDPEVLALLARVDGGRILADVRKLAGYKSRSAFSTPAPPAGDGHGSSASPAEWLRARFEEVSAAASAQLLVETEPFDLGSGRGGRVAPEQQNTIATLSGIGARKRFVYAVGHLDSRGLDPADGAAVAPGANDNASGVALLLEAARVLSMRQWDGTIRLVGLAAAEQGARGATHHASLAAEFGLPIEAVLAFDTVGRPLEEGRPAAILYADDRTDGMSQRLQRSLDVLGRRYGLGGVAAAAGPDRAGGDGDHLAFAASGFGAVLVTDSVEDQGGLRGAADAMSGVDAEALAARTRLAVAALADLALAPRGPTAAPVIERIEGREGALRIRWDPVADEAVAGYWVGVRVGPARGYDRLHWSGGSTETVVEALPTEGAVHAAVASCDAFGHTSLFGPEAAR